MKKLLSIFSIVFGMSSLAHAGILIDPYLGYETGQVKYTTVIGAVQGTNDISGTTLGLRLGYKFIIPYVALDYSMSTGKSKPSSGTETDFSQTGLGIVVGASLPFVSPYIGYGISNESKIKDDGTGNGDTTLKGTYIKVGVGTGFIPIVTLNFEYKMSTYDKYSDNGGEVNRSDVFSDLTHNTTMIAVSFPLNL